mmetsp:Transcript_21197/g.20360  ORF Transcript_21197/g.20360 Transcript_21197/m.20360 type:complete len:85 (-) Transcript_21197:4-258(-)
MVNPLVAPLGGGKSTLISFKYISKFRDFTAELLEELYKPKIGDGSEYVPKGMVVRNKKLEERVQKRKEQDQAQVANDPKKKGGA